MSLVNIFSFPMATSFNGQSACRKPSILGKHYHIWYELSVLVCNHTHWGMDPVEVIGYFDLFTEILRYMYAKKHICGPVHQQKIVMYGNPKARF